MTLDKDDVGDDPMEEVVRREVEQELRYLVLLKEELREARVLGPEALDALVRNKKQVLAKTVESYGRRLKSGMRVAESESYSPEFRRTRRELESIELAKEALI